MTIARLAAVFGAFLLLFIGLRTPMTVLISPQRLDSTGLSLSRIEGDWRQAILSDVRWRGYAIGDVTVRPLLSALLMGQLMFRVTTSRGGIQFDGIIGRGFFSSLLVKRARVSADLSGLPVLVQVSGRLSAEIEDLDYGPKGCRQAVGKFQTDALTRGIAGLPWMGPVLDGQLQCKDGAIMIPLSSIAAGPRVSSAMTLKPDGTFNARIEFANPDASIAQVLSQLGFRQDSDALALEQNGRWSK